MCNKSLDAVKESQSFMLTGNCFDDLSAMPLWDKEVPGQKLCIQENFLTGRSYFMYRWKFYLAVPVANESSMFAVANAWSS